MFSQNQMIFKTTLFGVKRDEVLEYIKNFHQSKEAENKSLNILIEQLSRSNDSLKNELNSFKANDNALKAQLVDSRNKADQLNSKLKEINVELDRYKTVLSNKDNEITILKEKLNKIEAGKIKGQDMSSQILTMAKIHSKKIINEAKNEASIMLSDAYKESEVITTELISIKQEMLTMKNVIEECISGLNKKFKRLDGETIDINQESKSTDSHKHIYNSPEQNSSLNNNTKPKAQKRTFLDKEEIKHRFLKYSAKMRDPYKN